ncbi:MAG: beta-ketoacyl-[acyl-carrier-protein] synthase family protein [Thermodesulfovibrionales bacterium]
MLFGQLRQEVECEFYATIMTMVRVVVTGIGSVTPIGNSFLESWKIAKSGISGISQITRFDTSGIKWKVAGEIKGFDAEAYLTRKEINRLDPFVHYAVGAAIMAVEDAGLIKRSSVNIRQSLVKTDGKRLMTSERSDSSLLDSAGIIIGSSRGGITTIEKELQKIYESRITHHASYVSAYLMASTTISMAASYVAQKLGIHGYCLGISNACASGTNAIGEAYRLIKSGYKGPVLCGGAEAPVCRICVEGYGISGALSKVKDSTASRPFDITRDGFVLSEGACILILENYETALKRGARIYGEIIGYGNTTDAFHQTRPSPYGEAEAMRKAIEEAGLKPEDIDYINAHATSTPLGDKTEIEAIKMVFGEKAKEIPISSVKSMTGHMLAASGAFEVAITLMSIKEGIIPPIINLKETDPECDIDLVKKARKAKIDFAISNSFGFGGVNAVLVLKNHSLCSPP